MVPALEKINKFLLQKLFNLVQSCSTLKLTLWWAVNLSDNQTSNV